MRLGSVRVVFRNGILDLGPAQKTAASLDELSWNGIYRRDFDNGIVLVESGTSAVQVNLEAAYKRTEFVGGGAVSGGREGHGTRVTTRPYLVTALEIGAESAEILLR
jgi:hypothetical protein